LGHPVYTNCKVYTAKSGTVARKLFMTPDSDVFTICSALDVLSVGSVVKSFIGVARTDRCRREVNEVFGIRLPVLRQ